MTGAGAASAMGDENDENAEVGPTPEKFQAMSNGQGDKKKKLILDTRDINFCVYGKHIKQRKHA